MRIMIVRRPNGEAPEWVRDAWIGVSIPLLIPSRRMVRGFGVLTGPRGVLPQIWAMLRGRTVNVDGFVVNARIAVDCLEGHRPDAAAWWRLHTPRLLRKRTIFMFDAAACELLS
ncbi:MAG TPA: hypothetical protein QF469_05820 [Sphingomonas sanguinis]|uniref:hypothetical protein n=1 Tax=Sphingomonas sanguinis TaxID=33051 RepID=UPI002AC11D35|nr:hypothetical protein [Sphingomonas sanguinis]